MMKNKTNLQTFHNNSTVTNIQDKTIYVGDVLCIIEKFPTEYFDCILFSPPYYNDVTYNSRKEWGKEKSVFQYLQKMRQLQNALYRILKSTGTMFVNISDSYAKRDDGPIKKGSEYGVPEAFAYQCILDGWIKENTITWLKRNAMPTSSKVNFWRNTESVFFLVKQKPGHYLNKEEVFVPKITNSVPFNRRVRDAKNGKLEKRFGKTQRFSEDEIKNSDKFGISKNNKQDMREKASYPGLNQRWDSSKTTHRDPGLVLDITIKGTSDFHFATFPVDFAEWFLKCGAPPGGRVLDPFIGSGSTALAAENLGLYWNGIELKSDYARKAVKRIGEGTIATV